MKFAMVFPGQGSQSVGMLQAYAGLPGVAEVVAEAQKVLGREFVELLDKGPAASRNSAEVCKNTNQSQLTHREVCSTRA